MKGIILAGGQGTRLFPLTKLINKHLLPVGRYPMIHYAIAKLCEADIRDIMIVIGKQSAGVYMDYLGSGHDFGAELTFRIQEEAGGIAEALLLAESFIPSGDKFVTLLGDNLFEDSLAGPIAAFGQQRGGAKVMLKTVEDARRYGVPTFERGQIAAIQEKPKQPPTNYCVTGIYMYDSSVFGVIRGIQPSARGELEITDVNNVYASRGTLTFDVLGGWWIDAGTFESLAEASRLTTKKTRRTEECTER
ncbi:sugar phosphate nucleotidyltransferase [Paenibacillus cymbidii]|uniref:sugar phosphate nucleotidyltransferase n=1 Tax=Paenibacillus cymbidii TaxID=1639034 RepID=UPI001080DC58|nr:sugar phosphate nucleotidyltransferase [Paenibacillus cymbidii]